MVKTFLELKILSYGICFDVSGVVLGKVYEVFPVVITARVLLNSCRFLQTFEEVKLD